MFLGNMVLKGCISVPLARVSGSILQRYLKTHEGYYVGIIGATIIVAIWDILELISILKNNKDQN